MKRKSFRILLFILGIAGIFLCPACEKNDDSVILKEEIVGFVQKGPFNNGTAITIATLNDDLTPTGNTFTTQITDNRGKFEIRNVELPSQYVELRADGFYFNEITDENSAAQLTLFGLSDLSDSSSININIMSHLEKNRVEYLISEGYTFSEAKDQAQQEVLSIFSIENTDIVPSEYLDITSTGDDNAMLLAVSIILQGYRTVAELSELLANISTDIREDGELNSTSSGTALINHTRYMNMETIRQNLTDRYENMGVDVVIPDFEKYITRFTENTAYIFTSFINYPAVSDYGINILNDMDSIYTIDLFDTYSIAAEVPEGATLKVVLEFVEGGEPQGAYWAFRAAPSGPINWKTSIYDLDQHTQTFEVIESGSASDMNIIFMATEDTKIRISYFENSMDITRVRSITIVK